MTPSTHPSPFTLERLALGELSGAEAAEVQRHVGGCARCKARLAEMDAQAAGFSRSSHSSPARLRVARADRAWKRNAMLVTLVPAAAALALVVASPWSRPPEVDGRFGAPVRQGRAAVELRPGPELRTLRSLSLRGQPVEVGQGTLEAATDDGPPRPFVLEHTHVVAEVTGFASAVTVTQRFRNPFATPVEAVYVFPLPDDAGVDEMTLKAGTRVIKATIQKRAQARRMYEEAKASGRRAALLDQERPNIFTQSVANLLPGEAVEVTLRYVARLAFDDGAYTFNFPMVVGPRYVPGAPLAGESQGTGTSPDTTRVLDASRITPPSERPGRDISVEVRLEAGTIIEQLWSVSHRLTQERTSSSRAVITLDPADRVPNRDLIVRWSVSGEQLRAAVLGSGGPDGAFALMLNPPARPTEKDVTPRELVFLIDTSCSMAGAPLAAAKSAMRQAMGQLRLGDTFMLIDFADRASSFHDAPLPATPPNVQRALSYLNALPAGGGTNQLDGVRRALGRPTEPGRLRVVLLMTDGFIGNEREILAETTRLLGGARLFGFGIGGSVNHFLLSRLSETGRGFYQYVRTDEDPTAAVQRFVRRIERPLLTDVSLSWEGLEVREVLPARLPDLFDAQPLIVVGRYRRPGVGTVTLRGLVNGRMVELPTRVDLPEQPSASGLTTLWARAKVEELDRLQHFGEFSEAVQAITTLGLEHHLVTAYTSFVAVEQTPVTTGTSTTVVVPTGTPDDAEAGEGSDRSRMGWVNTPVRREPAPMNGARLTLRPGASTIVLESPPTSPDSTVAPPPVADPAPPATTPKPPPVGFFDGDARRHGASRPTTPETVGEAKRGVALSDAPASSREGDDLSLLYDGSARKGGAVTKPPARELRALGSEPADNSTLTQAEILDVIAHNRHGLAACAAKQREAMPGTTGKLVVSWVIGRDGRVTKVTLVSTGFQRFPIASCVMNLIKAWRFPAHNTPGVPVTFPFTF
ncbi:MAG: AgmX/PglI C-terminal domain-containing protein [Myxococcaceae bacterium]|nr:AgmX/PglI C-terminal domain-containing protein [Myxococcaceae bacterium]